MRFRTANADVEEDALVAKMIAQTKDKEEKTVSLKWNNAIAFIESVALMASEHSPNPGEEKLKVLPYETVSRLYAEYRAYSEYDNLNNP